MKTIKDLNRISEKKTRTIVGMMSGTSLDGIDVSLFRVKGTGSASKLTVLKNRAFQFPKGMQEMLLKNSETGGGNVADICRLNFMVANVYSDCILKTIRSAGLSPKDVDLIGSHGQTIHHMPIEGKMFGVPAASTLQIGDPAVIAKKTGIITIGDFRTGDIALGGQGAPLIPYFDYILYSSKKNNRALLNIGGISNMTVLPANGKSIDAIAFDTGPGNMLIDYQMKKYFNLPFDKNGKIGFSGTVQRDIVDFILEKDSNLAMKPPKSSGREFYGKTLLNEIIKKFKKTNPVDLISSISFYTACSVYLNYKRYIEKRTAVNEIIVSGGGSRNLFILAMLQELFGDTVLVTTSRAIGLNPDFKEALCFGIYANELIAGNPITLPQVTGAKEATLAGKICLP